MKKIIQSILHFLGVIKDEVEDVVNIGNSFVNTIMEFTGTPTGKVIENIIESVLPPGLANGFKLALPVIFKVMQWVKNHEEKSDEEVISEGLEYLKNLPASAKAAQLNSFAALTADYVNVNQEGGPIVTTQQLLALAQPVHNPDTFSTTA